MDEGENKYIRKKVNESFQYMWIFLGSITVLLYTIAILWTSILFIFGINILFYSYSTTVLFYYSIIPQHYNDDMAMLWKLFHA